MLYRGDFALPIVGLGFASMIDFPQSRETLFRIPANAVTRVGATNRC